MASEAYDELMRELTTSIIVDTGLNETIANECARVAMEVLQRKKSANGLLYVASPVKQLNVMQIQAELRGGKSVRWICKHHGTTRRRLQQEFPNGIPHRMDKTVKK